MQGIHLYSDEARYNDNVFFFQIEPDDSALMLNLKCFEACIESFHRLVADVMADRVTRTAQDLEKRSYFGLYDVPPNLGVLNFHSDVRCVYNNIRALQFGPQANQLGSPKICTITGHILLVIGADIVQQNIPKEKTAVRAGRKCPGLVGQVAGITVVVGTNTDDIKLTLAELDGSPVTSENLKSYAIFEGSTLETLPEDLSMTSASEIRKRESFWKRKIKMYDPTTFFIQKMNVESNIYGKSERNQMKVATFPIPQVNMDQWNILYRDFMEASFVVFVGRTCCATSVHIGLLADRGTMHTQLQGCYANVCPGIFNIDFNVSASDAVTSCIKTLCQLRESKTFLLDMFYRYPELRGLKTSLYHNMVLAFGSDVAFDLFSCREILEDGKILITLSSQNLQVFYLESRGNSHVIDVLRHFPTFLKSLLSLDKNASLLDVSLISSNELKELYPKPENGYHGEVPQEDLLDDFRHYCSRQPQRYALSSTGKHLRYAEVQEEVHRLSELMKEFLPYDSHEDRPCIALHLDKSLEYIVCLLSAVSLHCPFLPIPEDVPTERMSFMLQDAG
ncbi:uncharacterized protein LOC101858723 [Aplysia californica]|uniref:Uncharacterized protein LOC101858723 n=1 Tax=Aplysia californica TaxID=6500 RepID=A0ABM1A417_APLCA|nr:uncharacterized protein LOC101858723 [Aplysia californica]